LATQLKLVAGHAQLRRHRKHPRGPKKAVSQMSRYRAVCLHRATTRITARKGWYTEISTPHDTATSQQHRNVARASKRCDKGSPQIGGNPVIS
jgi:hypothetical protein